MSQVLQLFSEPTHRTTEKPASRFNEFWAMYPRKVGKPLAQAKYNQIVKGCKTKTVDRDAGGFMEIELQASEDEIIEGLKRYVASLVDLKTFKRKVEDKFIPHAATWLNQGRWMDE